MKIERKELLEYNHTYIHEIEYNKSMTIRRHVGYIPGHTPPVYYLTFIMPDIYYDIYKKLIT